MFKLLTNLAATCCILSSSVFAQPLTPADLEGCPSATINAAFSEFGRTGKMDRELHRWLNDAQAQHIEPYEAFDNVYYVGVCWVSSWLIKTDEGAVLIDTLTGPFSDQLIRNIESVGVQPEDIKLVLMTHGHFDHTGGASKLKALSNAQFVMTEEGWNEAFEDANKRPKAYWDNRFLAEADIVAKDGDSFTVGGREFTLLSTPGHTWGTASYVFDVADGANSYRAISIGGLGLNAIGGPEQVEAYIESIERIEGLVEDNQQPISVHLTAHPFSNGMTEASKLIELGKASQKHPLDDKQGLIEQLHQLKKGAQQRLIVEQQ
ncbi:MBL fold metallo-hydrolase [Ferrimonas lipolytica]|uniref:MBL fold metallo-hydrolase n=1 Tax=Ferrimonas lipolytica TaxID=2724191 RepID=A0A6H1UD44_9GAMM|nr:MBL fold metallo-hydrolase [Ferrimonas lipolytica]QIZ76510.1 MBL fold metallo-hydrolase [Ferrimonas lipolytica]